MGILLNSITKIKQLECEFFRVECFFASNASPDALTSYILYGESMKGDQIIIDVLTTSDISAIRELCDKAKEYGKQAMLQYEAEKREVESQEIGDYSGVDMGDR